MFLQVTALKPVVANNFSWLFPIASYLKKYTTFPPVKRFIIESNMHQLHTGGLFRFNVMIGRVKFKSELELPNGCAFINNLF